MSEFTMHGTGFMIWTGFIIVATIVAYKYIPEAVKKFLGSRG